MKEKRSLRRRLRKLRREHVAVLPDSARGLVFHRPPSPIAAILPAGATIGLYHASGNEAPTAGYAAWLYENGYRLCLPWFADKAAPLQFREWRNPFDEDELETGPFGIQQPASGSVTLAPDVAFVPLLGFTASGERLGRGGGHYDRWLVQHPGVTAIGLAWDCQLVESLPTEEHDHLLHMVVTPTRLYQGEETE